MDFLNSFVADSENPYLMTNEKYSNLNALESYPANPSQGVVMPSDKFTESITTIDFKYDYSNVPMNYDSKTFWEEMAEPVTDATGYVWDTATGAWESTKNAVVKAGDTVLNAVDSAGTKLTETVDSLYWSAIKTGLLVLAAVMLLIFVIGKSGILKDVVNGLGIVYGK